MGISGNGIKLNEKQEKNEKKCISLWYVTAIDGEPICRVVENRVRYKANEYSLKKSPSDDSIRQK